MIEFSDFAYIVPNSCSCAAKRSETFAIFDVYFQSLRESYKIKIKRKVEVEEKSSPDTEKILKE